MSAIFQRLAQALPERHVPGKNSFATETKALRIWIEHLPLANPTATARLLINALHEMNQLQLDPAQRSSALEMLRGPCAQIVASLDRLIHGDIFPLPPQKQQMGELAKDFERELASGYSALVHDLCAPAGAVPFMRSKAVALALSRAIQHHGAHLYKAYLLYQMPPPGVWQTLHDLFRFAVAVRLDEKSVEDPLLEAIQFSPRETYMHALLFALSNPYRFTQKENIEVYALTRIFAPYCELRQGRAPDGAIAVRVDRDDSLCYLPEEREVPAEGLWAFEISGLTRFLDGELALLPADVSSMQFRLKGQRCDARGNQPDRQIDLCLERQLGTQSSTLASRPSHGQPDRAARRTLCTLRQYGFRRFHAQYSWRRDQFARKRSRRIVDCRLPAMERAPCVTASRCSIKVWVAIACNGARAMACARVWAKCWHWHRPRKKARIRNG